MPHQPLSKEEQRIGIFVDGPNLFHAQKNMDWWIQPKRIIEFFEEDVVAAANYYLSYDPASRNDSFIKALRYMGFTVFDKAARSFKDRNTQEDRLRVDLDVDIVLDLVMQAEKFDAIVLVSGNRVFTRTLEALKNKGKDIIVMSARSFLSDDLANVAGRNVYYLDDLREELERTEEDISESQQGTTRKR